MCAQPPAPDVEVVTAAGGGGCSATGPSGPEDRAWPLLLLLALGLIGRRRRGTGSPDGIR
jgi:MYXO-CTERM domain-containing protein